ncbi:putative RNA-directed DNA polymerase from transposon X-element [Trichonephila clavipes]|nr:putative RNA-directed DNA polymerase from transposon X-element [Trichonephila clavipes]
MRGQKVCAVRRITIWKDGQALNTKHLILTFSTPDLPQFVKMAYLRCPVQEYIPNPLRCFECQRYGHSKKVCRGQPTCPRCGEMGHDNNDCSNRERCVNCKGSACCLTTHTSPWCKLCKCRKETTQANFTQHCAEHFKELEEKNSSPLTENSPPSTKKSSPSTMNSPPPAKKKIISRPLSTSPKSRRSRQREMSLSKQPRKLSNFSKKSYLMDEDMLDFYPDDDEDLMGHAARFFET